MHPSMLLPKTEPKPEPVPVISKPPGLSFDAPPGLGPLSSEAEDPIIMFAEIESELDKSLTNYVDQVARVLGSEQTRGIYPDVPRNSFTQYSTGPSIIGMMNLLSPVDNAMPPNNDAFNGANGGANGVNGDKLCEDSAVTLESTRAKKMKTTKTESLIASQLALQELHV